METKFQSSFIPKKPLPSVGMQGVNTGVPTKLRPVHTTSLLLNIAILIFIVSIGSGAVVYAWKVVLENNLTGYKQELEDKQKQFNPDLINQLKVVNIKIDNAKHLLAKHMAVSTVFDVVSRMTSENIRFLSMEVTTPMAATTQNGGSQVGSNSPSNISITLSGQGLSLSAVAFQAQILAELDKYNLKDIVKNPVLSDPSIEADGSVLFKMSQEIDPSTVIYMKGASSNQQ
ncbi:MAG: hypothetical protein WCV79_02445 [Candidatus Paceibacterota bacterium]|jgi:hypothetical protein